MGCRIRCLLLLLIFCFTQAHANVVGVDTQNFNPTNDGLDFVTVHSSKTLTPGVLNLGVFVNYAINSLPNYEDSISQTRTNFRDALLSSDLNFGLGVARNWEVGLSLPSLLYQDVKSDLTTTHGQFAMTGATEFRLMTKGRLFGDQNGGMATVISANFNEIQNDPFVGQGAGPTLNLELVGDHTLGAGFAWAINGGFRLRHPGAQLPGVPIQPLGNEYIASTALSYLVSKWDTKIIAEIFGSLPATHQQFISDRSSSSAEALLGIKSDINQALAFHFGGGSEIIHGVSSPDWRVYTGINWVIGPLFSKPRQTIVRVQEHRLKSLAQIDAGDPFAGAPKLEELFIARDVLFEFDSDKLQPGAGDLLKQLIAHLHKPPGFKSLSIEGHTDSIGSHSYNIGLSQRRANRVRDALIALGLPGDRVTAVGFGATQPLASNGNYQGRAINRRVEFKVKR